jgi:SsrA-binding protein
VTKPDPGNRVLSDNRQARHYYSLLEHYEAGIVMAGTEVKAAKLGKVQLTDAYAEIRDGEAWLVNAHISPYSHGNIMNHAPERKRKLLLHKAEIEKLKGKTQEKGLSLIPLKVYLKNGKIKVELALGRGKKLHDKRESEKQRSQEMEARQAMRARNARYS